MQHQHICTDLIYFCSDFCFAFCMNVRKDVWTAQYQFISYTISVILDFLTLFSSRISVETATLDIFLNDHKLCSHDYGERHGDDSSHDREIMADWKTNGARQRRRDRQLEKDSDGEERRKMQQQFRVVIIRHDGTISRRNTTNPVTRSLISSQWWQAFVISLRQISNEGLDLLRCTKCNYQLDVCINKANCSLYYKDVSIWGIPAPALVSSALYSNVTEMCDVSCVAKEIMTSLP